MVNVESLFSQSIFQSRDEIEIVKRRIRSDFSLKESLILEKVVEEFFRIAKRYPASVKGHHSEEGGLFSHSVEVAFQSIGNLSGLDRVYGFISGLFHDVGKIFRYRWKEESSYDFRRGISNPSEYFFSEVYLDMKDQEYEGLMGVMVVVRVLERAGFFESELYVEEKVFSLIKDISSDFQKRDEGEKNEKSENVRNEVKKADVENAKQGLMESFEKSEDIKTLLDAVITEMITTKRLGYDFFVSSYFHAFFITENTLNFIVKMIQKKAKKYISQKEILNMLKKKGLLEKPRRYVVKKSVREVEMVLWKVNVDPGIYYDKKALESVSFYVTDAFFENQDEKFEMKELDLSKFDEGLMDILYSFSDDKREIFENLISEINHKLEAGELIENFHIFVADWKGRKQVIVTSRALAHLDWLQKCVDIEVITPAVELKIRTRKKKVKTFDAFVLPVEILSLKNLERFKGREVERLY